MKENLVLPPSIINNTIVGLSKDKMSTVWWNTKTKRFESAHGLYTVAEVADAPPASNKQKMDFGVSYMLSDKYN